MPARVTQAFTEWLVRPLDNQFRVTQLYAEVITSLPGENLHCLDIVLDRQKPHWTWLHEMLAPYRSSLIYSNAKFKIITDRADLPTRFEFGAGNMLEESVNLQIVKDPLQVNQAVVEFANRDLDFERDVLYMQNSAAAFTSTPLKPFNMDLVGISRTSEAMRIASLEMQRRNTKIRNISFQTDLEAVPLEPGDVFAANIPVSNWDMGIGGRLVDGSSVHAVLDRELEVKSGQTYEIYLWHTDADTVERVSLVSSPPGFTITVTPTQGFSYAAKPGESYAIGVTSRDVLLFRTTKVAREQTGRHSVEGTEYLRLEYQLYCPSSANTAFDLDRPSQPSCVTVAIVNCTATLSLSYLSPQTGTVLGYQDGLISMVGPHNPNPSSEINDSLSVLSGAGSGFSSVIKSWFVTNVVTVASLINPTAETQTTTGWTSEIGAIGINFFGTPHTGSWFFWGGPGTEVLARQRINVANYMPNFAVDAGMISFRAFAYMAGISPRDSDTGEIGIRFLNNALGTIATTYSGLVARTTTWTPVSHIVQMPTGTRFVDFLLHGVRGTGDASGIDAYWDDMEASFVVAGNLPSPIFQAYVGTPGPAVSSGDLVNISLNTSLSGFVVRTNTAANAVQQGQAVSRVYSTTGIADITGYGYTQQINVVPFGVRGGANDLGTWVLSRETPNCGDFSTDTQVATVVSTPLTWFMSAIIPGSTLGATNIMDIEISGLLTEACSTANETTNVNFYMTYGGATVAGPLAVTLNAVASHTTIGSDNPVILTGQIVGGGATNRQSANLTYQGIQDTGNYVKLSVIGAGTVDGTLPQTIAFGAQFSHLNSAGLVHSHNCYSFSFRDGTIDVTSN